MEREEITQLKEIRDVFLKMYHETKKPDISIDMSFLRLHNIISRLEEDTLNGR